MHHNNNKKNVNNKNNCIVNNVKKVKAITKMIRISPYKLNLVASTIRRQNVDKAVANLTFSRKRISIVVKKTVMSAISNAENNYHLNIDNLIVSEAYVGKSLVMKRFRARARGRVGKINKYFSNLTIILEHKENKL